MSALFTRSFNRLPQMLLLLATVAGFLILAVFYYSATPSHWRKGYTPEQPIPFSHKLHVSELGMDCVSCHAYAGEGAIAGIPDEESCLACHKFILPDSPALSALHAAANPESPLYTGEPILWERVHRLPGHSVFVHAPHVNRGVACDTCHGPVAGSDRLGVTESLSMGWCLDCHRNPEPYLRPLEKITSPDYTAETFLHDLPMHDTNGERITSEKELQSFLKARWIINPPTDCTSCHH